MTHSLYQMCMMLFNTVSIYSSLFTSLPNIFVNKYRTAAIIILTHFYLRSARFSLNFFYGVKKIWNHYMISSFHSTL